MHTVRKKRERERSRFREKGERLRHNCTARKKVEKKRIRR